MKRWAASVVAGCVGVLGVSAGSALAAAPADGLYSGGTAQGAKTSVDIRVVNGRVTAIQTRLNLTCPATGRTQFVDLGGGQGRLSNDSVQPALRDARDGDFAFYQVQNAAQWQTLLAVGVVRGRSFKGYIVATAAGGDPSARGGLTFCGTNKQINYTATLRRRS